MKKYLGISLALGIVVLVSGCSTMRTNVADLESTTDALIVNSGSTVSLNEEQKSKLQYLLQEEKLARDVYSEMFKVRGNKKFSNILNSEENHQTKVAQLLDNYGIVNPIQDLGQGEFSDAEFTNLYKQLVASGSVSLADALQVGIDIEVMDIKDIEVMMPLFTGKNDILQVLNSLLEGSKRHLAAFSK